MKRLVFAPAAREEMMTICLNIAEDNPGRGERFIAELKAKSRQRGEWPTRRPAREHISPGQKAAVDGRHLPLFRDLDNEARIVRVVHGARH